MNVGDEDAAKKEFDRNPTEEAGSQLLGIYARLGKMSEFQTTLKLYDLDPASKLPNGLSYLHLAAQSNTSGIFEYLITEFKLNPLFHSDFNQTPLHFAAIVGNVSIIKFICQKLRKNPNVYNVDDITPLHYACLHGKYETVLCLIEECSAEITQTKSGAFPIHFAAKGGNAQIVKYLSNEKSVPSKTKKGHLTSLHFACHKGSIAVVSTLMDEYNCFMLPIVTFTSAITSSPLYIALTKGHLDIAECLLANLSCSEYRSIEASTHIKQLLKMSFVSKLDTKAAELLDKFKRIDSCEDVDNFVKVVFLGDSGAGKSTLIQVLKDRSSSILSQVVGRFCKTNEVEPLTAGIVPVKLPKHREFGSIVIHDIAGQISYFSSHNAVLEKLVESSDVVFVLLVNLLNQKELRVASLSNWISLMKSDQAKHSLIVVASHMDELSKEEAVSRIKHLTVNLKKHGIQSQVFGLDCRKIASGHFTEFGDTFKAACSEVRKKNTKNSRDKKFNLRCRMLYAHLLSLKKPFIKLCELQLDKKSSPGTYYLPQNIDDLQMCLASLHSFGLIVFLINKNRFDESWIIINVEMLFSEVNGIIFAPKEFDEYCDGMVSNTGIMRRATLSQVFEYDVEMLVQFLVHSELCIEISAKSLMVLSNSGISSLSSDYPDPDEKLLFFPALINETLCSTEKIEFHVGWYLATLDTTLSFSQPFLHHLMLHIAYKHALPKHFGADHKYDRRCDVWHTGIKWTTSDGLCVLVEVVEEYRGLIVLLRASRKDEVENHGEYLLQIMNDILMIQQKDCPDLSLSKYLIDHSSLQYPIKSPKELPLYDIPTLASCYKENKQIVPSTNAPCTTSVNILLPFNQKYTLLFLEIPEDEIKNDLSIDQVATIIPTTSTSEDPGTAMCLDIYRSLQSVLADCIHAEEKLLVDLYAGYLVGEDLKDAILTTHGLSRHQKLTRILHEVERNLKTSPNQLEFLEKFCIILKKQGYEYINDIAQNVLDNINLNKVD